MLKRNVYSLLCRSPKWSAISTSSIKLSSLTNVFGLLLRLYWGCFLRGDFLLILSWTLTLSRLSLVGGRLILLAGELLVVGVKYDLVSGIGTFFFGAREFGRRFCHAASWYSCFLSFKPFWFRRTAPVCSSRLLSRLSALPARSANHDIYNICFSPEQRKQCCKPRINLPFKPELWT